MVKENLPGLMVEDILENIKKIKNMDMESSNGLMVENTKEVGKMENNMEEEFISVPET